LSKLVGRKEGKGGGKNYRGKRDAIFWILLAGWGEKEKGEEDTNRKERRSGAMASSRS